MVVPRPRCLVWIHVQHDPLEDDVHSPGILVGLLHEVVVKVKVYLAALEVEGVLDDQVRGEVELAILVGLDGGGGDGGVGVVRDGLLLSLWVVLGVGRCLLPFLLLLLLLFHVQGRLGQPLDQERGGSELGLGQDAQQVPKVYGHSRMHDRAV